MEEYFYIIVEPFTGCITKFSDFFHSLLKQLFLQLSMEETFSFKLTFGESIKQASQIVLRQPNRSILKCEAICESSFGENNQFQFK